MGHDHFSCVHSPPKTDLCVQTTIIDSSVVVQLAIESQPVKRRLSMCYSETVINPLPGYN
jgi:hypothetical protein